MSLETTIENLPEWLKQQAADARAQSESAQLKRDRLRHEGRALAYEHVYRVAVNQPQERGADNA